MHSHASLLFFLVTPFLQFLNYCALSSLLAPLADAPLTWINSSVEECGRLCHSGPAEFFDCAPARHDSVSHLSPRSWKNVSFNSCFELRTQTTTWGSGVRYWQCGQLWISEGGGWRFEPLRKIMEGEPDQRGTIEENYQEATEIQHFENVALVVLNNVKSPAWYSPIHGRDPESSVHVSFNKTGTSNIICMEWRRTVWPFPSGMTRTKQQQSVHIESSTNNRSHISYLPQPFLLRSACCSIQFKFISSVS